jgi:signal peptidase I
MKKESEKRVSIALAAGLGLSIALYVALVTPFFAVTGFLCLAGIILLDFWRPSSKNNSVKLQLKETAVSLAIAVAAWYSLVFLLNTGSPLNVVTSCSMVPVLERGDFIILQGADYEAREVELDYDLSKAEYIEKTFRVGGEYYKFTEAYVGGEKVLSYGLGACTVATRGGKTETKPCTHSVEAGGRRFADLKDGDVIVYLAEPEKYGLIIHRILLKIKAEDGVYYVTKGDNNRFADQQAGITLVPEERVQGRVFARVPLIGYVKLFLFMQFEEPVGCDKTIEKA